MDYLTEFDLKISLVDGMLIETGGKFAEFGLQKYMISCLEIAIKHYETTGNKKNLLDIVYSYIEQYEDAITWKFYDYEMKFLNMLKTHIEQL